MFAGNVKSLVTIECCKRESKVFGSKIGKNNMKRRGLSDKAQEKTSPE